MKTQFSPTRTAGRADSAPVAVLLACVSLVGCAAAHAAEPANMPPYAGAPSAVRAANVARGGMTDAMAPAGAQGALVLDAGKGTVLPLNENAVSVFVADPAVADVHVPSPRAVFVLGKKTGTTTLYVLGANNRPLVQRTIVVSRDMITLRAMLAARFPNTNVQVATGQGSLMLSGQAATPADADAVVQAVTPYLADKEVLVNRMTIDRPLQVQLRVRITEVDRNITQQLGIN